MIAGFTSGSIIKIALCYLDIFLDSVKNAQQ